MSDAFYLNSSDREKIRSVLQVVQGGNGSSRPLPRRRRGPRSLPGTSSTMLLVEVNQNISADTNEVTVDKEYYEVIFGSEDRDVITIDNSIFREEFTPPTKVPCWKRESDGKYVPDRLGSDSATMLVGDVQTQQTGDFSVDEEYYRIVFGQEDRPSIDVVNTQSETIEAGTQLPVWRRLDGKYEPDRSGAAGNPVVGFRLQADLDKDQDYASAEIVDRFNNPTGDITVWNSNRQFVGKGPWSDPRGNHFGFRGFCVAVPGETQNDRPLYRIITMEGMMRDIAVQLAADQNDAVADTPVVPLNSTRYGHPFNGRFPRVSSATNQFTAQDPLGIAKGAKIGQRFFVKYSAPDDEYHFVHPIDAPTMLHVTLPSNTSASSINVAAANYRVVFGSEDRSTITIDNVWDEEFNGGDRLTVFKRADGLYEADRSGGAGAATALFVTIPSGLNVFEEDETYLIPETSYRVIYGEENRVQVSVVNTFDEELSPGDQLVVFKRDGDGQYEPDRKGEVANRTMLHITIPSAKNGTSFIVQGEDYRVVYGEETRSTITIRNVFGESFVTGDKLSVHRRSDGDYEPDRGGQGTGATMVYATIGTTTSESTFNVTTYEPIFGTEERATLPVDNKLGETFLAGDQVPMWKRNSDGVYVADREGSNDATMVVGQCIENVYDEDLSFSVSPYTVVFGSEDRILLPVNNRYGEEFQQNQWVPLWRRSDGVYEPDRSGTGSDATMVKATVPSNTSSSFTTASYVPVFGSEVRDNITVNNPYGESFQANDVIPCWRRGDGTYEPDRLGAGTAPNLVMALARVPIDTSNAFTTDDFQIVFGVENNASIGVTNPYGESFVEGELIPCWKNQTTGLYEPDRVRKETATCCVLRAPVAIPSTTGEFSAAVVSQVFGEELRGSVTVTNRYNEPFDNNEHFIAWLRTDNAKYEPDRGRGYNTAVGTNSSAITRNSVEVELVSCTAVNGKQPPSTITASIPSYARMDAPSNSQIYIRWNEGAGSTPATKWDTGDARNLDWMLRGKADWNPTEYQILVSDGPNESDRKWVEAEEQVIFLADPAPQIVLSNPTATSIRVQIQGQKRSVRVLPTATAVGFVAQGDLQGTACPPSP